MLNVDGNTSGARLRRTMKRDGAAINAPPKPFSADRAERAVSEGSRMGAMLSRLPDDLLRTLVPDFLTPAELARFSATNRRGLSFGRPTEQCEHRWTLEQGPDIETFRCSTRIISRHRYLPPKRLPSAALAESARDLRGFCRACGVEHMRRSAALVYRTQCSATDINRGFFPAIKAPIGHLQDDAISCLPQYTPLHKCITARDVPIEPDAKAGDTVEVDMQAYGILPIARLSAKTEGVRVLEHATLEPVAGEAEPKAPTWQPWSGTKLNPEEAKEVCNRTLRPNSATELVGLPAFHRLSIR